MTKRENPSARLRVAAMQDPGALGLPVRSEAGKPQRAPKTRPSKKTKPRTQRLDPDAVLSPRRVIVAGRRSICNSVQSMLKELGFAVDFVQDVEDVPQAVDPSSVAVVFALEGDNRTGAAGVREVLKATPDGELPVFVIVPRKFPRSRVSRLYASGATAVFEWPREALTFPRLFGELVAVEQARGKPSAKDRLLARALQARLNLVFDRGQLQATVVRGTAYIGGTLPKLSDKKAVEGVLYEIPGVEDISTDQIIVAASSRSDAQLAGDARQLIKKTASIDDATLSVTARDGFIILTGTVADRAEFNRIVDVLHSLRGASGITNLTTISAHQKKVDRGRRTKAQKAVDGLLPKEAKVDVTVFGSVAVLSGRVPVLRYKREAEDIVQRKLPIQRMVNKIKVKTRP